MAQRGSFGWRGGIEPAYRACSRGMLAGHARRAMAAWPGPPARRGYWTFLWIATVNVVPGSLTSFVGRGSPGAPKLMVSRSPSTR